MPDAYTYVSKPTNSVYGFVNPPGKEQYDDIEVSYDDASVFYDGADPNAWSDVAKPTIPIMYSGIATGMLIPLTHPVSVLGTDWTNVNKPLT